VRRRRNVLGLWATAPLFLALWATAPGRAARTRPHRGAPEPETAT